MATSRRTLVPGAEALLYSTVLSHPSVAVKRMLEIEGVDFRVRNLVPGTTSLVRLFWFLRPHSTSSEDRWAAGAAFPGYLTGAGQAEAEATAIPNAVRAARARCSFSRIAIATHRRRRRSQLVQSERLANRTGTPPFTRKPKPWAALAADCQNRRRVRVSAHGNRQEVRPDG
jgi:hypothetical protein